MDNENVVGIGGGGGVVGGSSGSGSNEMSANYEHSGIGRGGEGGVGRNVVTPPPTVPTPVLVENWPTERHSFGQVAAVSIDPHGNPVIFHRADRYWDAK